MKGVNTFTTALSIAALAAVTALPAGAASQKQSSARTPGASTETNTLNAADTTSPSEEAAIQQQIQSVYRGFHESYRLGPGDVIAIHVEKHPDDSVERAVVSPVGQIYYPLMGNVTVVGKTVVQLREHFTNSISEFIKEPKVTLSLLEANSAKIGVLGDVRAPGVLVMTRPLRVLDAITLAGGITDTGSKSNVSILRQYEDGRTQILTVNVKRILEGKAGAEDNGYLRAGDTIIVHGNLVKKLGTISSMVGIASFATFLARGNGSR